ncbi:hypothetical protein ACFW9D_05765 [Streptomyces sp. NPDC059524]|uniref:hypothetical protein n=1 Tax=Streptomyces sp. NPDC059524 TaxID=3346856 RepID=UPI00367E334D
MSGKRKIPPVIPVIGSGDSGSSREDEMRQWEEQQAQLRAQQAAPAAAPQPAVAPVPAPAAAPLTPWTPSDVSAEEPAGAVAVTAPSAAGYLPMPEFTEPDSDDPRERLEFYTRGILAVQYAARSNHERAEQQKLIGLGLRLHAMKQEELHLEAGFDTFGDLTEARFGIKKHQANNIIRVLGVAQALEDITTQELKERPLRVLVPILDTHGSEAVRGTWLEAARHGNVTDTALKEAANFLGFAPPVDATPSNSEAGKKSKPAPRPSVSLQAVERIRSLAAQDPAKARREAEELESAVRELLEELAGAVQ